MKRFLACLSAALLALFPALAAATPVNIVDYGSSSSLTSTAATGNCTTGQVLVVFMANGAGYVPNGMSDSAGGGSGGALYTVSPAIFNPVNGTYVQGLIAKRVITAGTQIVSGTTTFTPTLSSGAATDTVLEAYCVADGAGIPTANDASFQPAAQTISASAPGASTSYQFALVANYAGGAGATVTSGGWTLGTSRYQGSIGGAVVWRQSAGSLTLTWTGTFGGGYDAVGLSEVTTGGGGGSTAKSQSLSLLGVQ